MPFSASKAAGVSCEPEFGRALADDHGVRAASARRVSTRREREMNPHAHMIMGNADLPAIAFWQIRVGIVRYGMGACEERVLSDR